MIDLLIVHKDDSCMFLLLESFHVEETWFRTAFLLSHDMESHVSREENQRLSSGNMQVNHKLLIEDSITMSTETGF